MGGRAASGASLGDATPGADLGGSSKYSNENFFFMLVLNIHHKSNIHQ